MSLSVAKNSLTNDPSPGERINQRPPFRNYKTVPKMFPLNSKNCRTLKNSKNIEASNHFFTQCHKVSLIFTRSCFRILTFTSPTISPVFIAILAKSLDKLSSV